MTADRNDLLPGTLELLVLKALSLEPMHGWGIGQRIDQLSKDVFRVAQGSLYPGLQRMLRADCWPTCATRPGSNLCAASAASRDRAILGPPGTRPWRVGRYVARCPSRASARDSGP